ncbi:MAG: helix-turn-helix transcriptional regulator [Ruminococcaceae bacterium]|nr:helix-turn-helix transcriptional regulator [Oscillospiraceae bacterium]
MFHIYERDLDPEFRMYRDGIYQSPVSPSHVNYYAEIILCLEGTFRMRVNQQERILHLGEGTLIHSLEVHEFLSDEQNRVAIFCFSPVLFSDLFDPSAEDENPVGTISSEAMNYVFYLIGKELSYPKHSQEIQLVLRTLLYEIPCPVPKQEQTLAVCRGVAYLEQHYAEEITLDQLARELGINRVYASQMFPKYLNGVTFTKVLSHIRLNRAIRLLGKTSVAQAALESGFGSVRQFNRVFKEITGKTPREYHDLEQNQIYRRII